MSQQRQALPLCRSVEDSLQKYFADMNGEQPANLYEMVLGEVERPLLRIVMEKARHNQTRAACMLGINRNTLRKKLRYYGLES